MEKILLKTLDRSEITINEAFELCFPERNIDQISNKDSRRMAKCLQKKWDGIKPGNTPVVQNATI